MRLNPTGLLMIALVACGSFGPGHAMAQSQSEPEKIDCGYPLTQMEMTYCAGEAFKQADAELNQVYSEAMRAMQSLDEGLTGSGLEGAADALREAQRAWVPFRDKACISQGFMARGGSMEPMLVVGCKATLTQQRIEDLKNLAEGLGN
ncbi:lysozyme inhibitor LprI family protein [Roseibium limicola]|uniref:lysozyme inhibitor LprI family protein n=1 Tax=Roseibium limicola TaxID=2816037 RepID=UPI001E3DDAB3|nr:lysozyme inhibitor LprI family protein [Roseibium limicola]